MIQHPRPTVLLIDGSGWVGGSPTFDLGQNRPGGVGFWCPDHERELPLLRGPGKKKGGKSCGCPFAQARAKGLALRLAEFDMGAQLSGIISKERRTPIRRGPCATHEGCEALHMVFPWSWSDRSPPILGSCILWLFSHRQTTLATLAAWLSIKVMMATASKPATTRPTAKTELRDRGADCNPTSPRRAIMGITMLSAK